jgi:hypothetical protein
MADFMKENWVWILGIGGGAYILFFTEAGDFIRCLLNPVSCAERNLPAAWDKLKQGAESVFSGAKNQLNKLGHEAEVAGENGFYNYSRAVEYTFYKPVANAVQHSAENANAMLKKDPLFVSQGPLAFGFKMGEAIGSGIRKSAADTWKDLQGVFDKKTGLLF